MAKYQVVVGNIGTVTDTDDFKEAHENLRDYQNQSRDGVGRAAGETVTFWRDGEPIVEYSPPKSR